MFQEFTGKQYLAIDIANNAGLDKLTWDERLAWFDHNEANLENLLNQAEEPALFYAAVKAYRDVQKGLPIGYPISLDATASGAQILACLTGDRGAAQLCNVVDTGAREDIYTNIYNAMLVKTGGSSKITRADTKQAIMTSFYSSTAMPKKVFGEGELLATFYETMIEAAPAAWELNETMLTLWNPEAHSNDWVLPDNFHVHAKVMDTVTDTIHFDDQPLQVSYKVNRPMPEGRSLSANMVHSVDGMIVREVVRRCNYDAGRVSKLKNIFLNNNPITLVGSREDDQMVRTLWNHYLETGFLSARILDHITNGNKPNDLQPIQELLQSLPAKPFTVCTIHDAFRCLPTYGNDLRRQYNLQLQAIAKSDLLSSIISQLVGRKVQIGKLDPTLWQDIAEANYALS